MKIKGEDFGSISRKQNLRDHPNLYSPNISLISISGIVSSVGLVLSLIHIFVNSTMGIDDKRNYPLYRTYSLGLSVQF